MKAARWSSISKLFDAACDLPAKERDTFLHQACGDDRELHDELQALLGIDETGPGALEEIVERVGAEVVLDAGPQAAAHKSCGPWELVEPVEGAATGLDFTPAVGPGERRALLKVFPGETVDLGRLERFLRDQQDLADGHPGVARLLDGGVTEDGQTYFASERVLGLPIAVWCVEHRPSIEQRLRLCRSVCAAVAHAHQQGMLHGDLEASNMLVTGEDAPCLLGFGIAPFMWKQAGRIARRLQPVLEHRSPEQVRGEAATEAADVYSLGVLLYQLLVGRRPFERGARPTHLLALRICEEEPRAPSHELARAERDLVAGDLDGIVLRALRKEPDSRYATVAGLVDDLDRYMTGRWKR